MGTPGSGVNLTTHQSGNSGIETLIVGYHASLHFVLLNLLPDSNLYRYLVGDVNEYDEDDEESDEDFVPEESRRKEIQVGPEYQAEIPEFVSDPIAEKQADSQTSSKQIIWSDGFCSCVPTRHFRDGFQMISRS